MDYAFNYLEIVKIQTKIAIILSCPKQRLHFMHERNDFFPFCSFLNFGMNNELDTFLQDSSTHSFLTGEVIHHSDPEH